MGKHVGEILLGIVLVIVAIGFVGNMQKQGLDQANAYICKDLQNTLDTDIRFINEGLKVKDLSLVHETGNKYIGYVKIMKGENAKSFKINVVIDGKSLMYEIDDPKDLTDFSVFGV